MLRPEEVGMNTKEISREQISALVDGELADSHIDVALAALRQESGQADWAVYHQIGDVLRSDDMAITLSAGFAERMSARLEAEPTIVAPLVSKNSPDALVATEAMSSSKEASRPVKRWALPGMVAAAAMATVAFVTTPQLMVAMKGEPAGEHVVAAADAVQAAKTGADGEVVVAASVPEGVVLRDARIDDYLLAHQRFSPSVYSTAQYARSAAFAADSGK